MMPPVDLRSLPLGLVLLEYRIGRILGQGGFGITYIATDVNLGRKVAIKEYYPRQFAQRDSTFTIRAAGDKEDRETFAWGLERFLEEARMLARFDHPNIVKVQRFFEKNGTAYLVMDYCEGESLDQIIKRDGPLRKEQVNPILLPLLDGLEHVHGANFLHRDIKPANIFIRADGSPVLLDFGSARQLLANHTRSVTALIADGYSPVEQYSANGKQGPWTDVYALGATFYRALTGKVPQDSPSRLLNDELVPVVKKARGNHPDSILASIDAAMVVRPEQRTQSVAKWRQMSRESMGQYKSSTGSVQCPWFVVATHKFVVLSICTFGLYQIFWFYKNWKSIKSSSLEDISPFGRSFFAPFWCFSFFRRVREAAVSEGVSVGWDATGLGAIYLILSFTWKFPDPWYLVTLFSFWPMVPVVKTLQCLNELHHSNSVKGENGTYSKANIAIIIVGGILFILSVIGSFISD